MTSRIVEPELLDELPAEDRAALQSRGDLRRLNWLMGHAGLLARELRNSAAKRICDLGSGDGSIMLRVATKLRRRDVELILVDRQPVIRNETMERFKSLGWRVNVMAEDVFDAMRSLEGCDTITANLFLHHFHEDALRELLALAAERTRFFVACEPRRSAMALFASHSVGAVGCNAVTRHDAVASVRAGFRSSELTTLWTDKSDWQIAERPAGLFTHLFAARKL